MAARTLADWNFFNTNVQSGLLEGRFLSAAFTMIAAGPPRLSAASTVSPDSAAIQADIAYPVGVLQSVNLGQNSQIMRLWEIGSERSYFVRGRTAGNVGLGRIMYHGPSLLRVLYAYLKSTSSEGAQFEQLYNNDAQASLNTSGTGEGKGAYRRNPGYENLWIDLASDVFSQPIGLLIYMRDSNESTVGAFYLEYCMVANHGWATDAGGTILTENAALMYERMVPVDMQVVKLIKNSDDAGLNEIVGSTLGSSA
jgi:hypothetical protein